MMLLLRGIKPVTPPSPLLVRHDTHQTLARATALSEWSLLDVPNPRAARYQMAPFSCKKKQATENIAATISVWNALCLNRSNSRGQTHCVHGKFQVGPPTSIPSRPWPCTLSSLFPMDGDDNVNQLCKGRQAVGWR
ncbi:hypothetical protein LCI18_008722 [Fusarium solani-melongenae]|uniref:Uncharacterized protein n=1 Tax=Fusarium solani subsp. cucurbitae TaxID=2747967 RepID=A0ACD3Z9A2_FUSSC|nr:hypothetical protein LCI18_008722 [Fusarium solani-melongenae]